MYKKYWQVLLSDWRKLGRDGLTIPFLIGSQCFSNWRIDLDVKKLIVDMASSPEFDVYLSYCLTINEVIIGVRDEPKERITGRFLLSSSGKYSHIFLTKFLDDLGKDVDCVGNALAKRYQHLIDSGKFSLNNGEWSNFSSDEIKFIKGNFEKLYE